MTTLAAIFGFSLGWAFGLYGFHRDYDYDPEVPFKYFIFRIICLIIIFFIALFNGVFQTGIISDNIDQTLGLIIAFGAGVFLHNEFCETEIPIPWIEDWLGDFEGNHGGRKSRNTANVALIRLAAYFYRPFLSEVEITQSLKHLGRFRNWDSLDIQIIIAQRSAERVMPVSIISGLGLKNSSKLKGIFSDLLWIGTDSYVYTAELAKRIKMVALSAGLSEQLFAKLQRKHKVDPEKQRQRRQSYQAEYNGYTQSQHNGQHHGQRKYEPAKTYKDEKSENLAVLGLKIGATKADLKSAFRKMAIKYHPDRNMNAAPSERERASEKMTEINLAYDWLQVNL